MTALKSNTKTRPIKLIIERKILNEVTLDDVKLRFQSKKFLKTFGERAQNIASNLSASIPDDIEEKYKGIYLNWLISWAIKSYNEALSHTYWFVEWSKILSDLKSAVEIYFQIKEQKLQRFLSKKSISQIASPDELISVVATAKPDYDAHIQNKIENSRKGPGQNLIFQNDEWSVYIPETKGAACALGKGTDWCTAAPGLEYYEDTHSPDDPLIIFISKKNPSEKYQFHYGSQQFMDKEDVDIKHEKVFYELNEIVKSLSSKLPKKPVSAAQQWQMEVLPNGGFRTVGPSGKEWYLNGKLHREDGPAIEWISGGKEWYLNGKLHREDGPAFELTDGTKKWFLNGKRHREDGPAVEQANGSKYWYRNDELHREDGPAVEFADGTKKWFLNGKLHREDGPAMEFVSGSKYWYLNGKYHREDGPAIELTDGTKQWWLNNKRHREDGPAIEYANGSKQWWLNGKYFSQQKWQEAIKAGNFERPGRPQLNESKRRRLIKLIIKS